MRILLILSCLLVATSALAVPVEWPEDEGGNGHYYEQIDNWHLSWHEARLEAESRTYNGLNGHLATVTSPAEIQLLEDNFSGFNLIVGAWQKQAWDPTNEDDLGWRWITGEPWEGVGSMNMGGENTFLAFTNNYDSLTEFFWSLIGPAPYYPYESSGYIVEYDELSVIDVPPEFPVASERSCWGSIKSLYH